MIEISRLAKEIGISEETYKKLIHTFIESTKSDLEQLQIAIKKENTPQIQEYCHHIKGAAINLELEKISEISKKMEKHVKKKMLANLKNDFSLLKAEFAKTVHFFKGFG